MNFGYEKDSLNRNQIRGLVKSVYLELSRNHPHMQVTMADLKDETPVSSEWVNLILERVGYFMDCIIPRRSQPRRGWKISTLVGYIHTEQENFRKVNPQ